MESTETKLTGPSVNRHRSEQVVATPWEFIRAIERKFGCRIFVDLAATHENAKASIFISPEIDTFKQDWTQWLKGGIGWLNPEFDPMRKWVEKCALEQQRGAEFFALGPASIGANWFWDYVKPFATVYSIGRLRFVGAKDDYPKDLILSHYNPIPDPVIQRWLLPAEDRRWKP